MTDRTRTLDVIAAVKGKDDREVVVAGEIADIRFPKGDGLSLLASKLFVQLLDLAGPEVAADQEHRVMLESLNWSHRDLAQIEDAVRELHGTTVSLTVQAGSVVRAACRGRSWPTWTDRKLVTPAN